MWSYSERLESLYETPFAADDPARANARRERASQLIEHVASTGRTLLTEIESKEILELYGIPIVPTSLAKSEDEAVVLSRKCGYPVVLKVHSETVTHKTEVDGVQLNLPGEQEVRHAYRAIASSVAGKASRKAFLGVTVQSMVHVEGYELILGSSVDSQFGPVLLFGSGGQLVEVYRDRALALPPLNTTLAERLMERTKIFTALKGVRRRKTVDLDALKAIVVRFSELVVDQPRLREIDINPLVAASQQLLALDARMVLFNRNVADAELPRSAIRRYPTEYVSHWTMKDGSNVVFRPIRPEDETLMVEFHKSLSDGTVYLRYFQMQRLESRVAHERLIRKCFLDYDREIALVVERVDKKTGHRELIAVGRLARQRQIEEAELGIVVADCCQGAGLGTELMRRLLQIARPEKIRRIEAHILSENSSMIALAKRFHFDCVSDQDPASLTATLDLGRTS
jgi:acetyltransferase